MLRLPDRRQAGAQHEVFIKISFSTVSLGTFVMKTEFLIESIENCSVKLSQDSDFGLELQNIDDVISELMKIKREYGNIKVLHYDDELAQISPHLNICVEDICERRSDYLSEDCKKLNNNIVCVIS